MRARSHRVSSKEAPEDTLAAFGSLHSGRATLREAANNDSKHLADCEAGTVVTVLEVGKSHSHVEINDQTGYLRNDCRGYSVLQREQVLRSMLVGGAKVNVRGGADKGSCRIAQWPAGTQVTIYGVDGSWCGVEYEGLHGWVAAKYVVIWP